MRFTQKTATRYIKSLLIAQGFPTAVVAWTEDLPPTQVASSLKIKTDREFWIVLLDYGRLTKVPIWIIPTILHEVGHVVRGHSFLTSIDAAEYEATMWAAQYLHHIKDRQNLIYLCDMVRKCYGARSAPFGYHRISKILVSNIVEFLQTLN